MEYSGIEAAVWVWRHLWKKDGPRVNFDILDVVMRDGSKIAGWLFTATDGAVKSKANFRWNEASVIERCTKDDMKTISGHEYVQRTWRSLALNEEQGFVHDMSPAVVLLGRINNPSFFIEQTYTFEPGEMLSKQVTNRLCPTSVKGTGTLPSLAVQAAPSSDNLPTHRLRNKDKKLNKLAEARTKEFVQMIENRTRAVVRKMTIIFLCEVERNGVDAAGGNLRLWLHHVSAVTADRKGGGALERGMSGSVKGGSVKGGWGDTRSETSATINRDSTSGTTAGRGGSMRCAGDFCGFVDEEEAALHGTDEGSVAEEARLAVRRHRRLAVSEEEGEGGLSPGGGDSGEDKASMHRQYGSGVLIGSQAYKVPQKNIVLVRNDMQKLEQLGDNDLLDPNLTDKVPWPTLVQHWWWRVGKAILEGKSKRVVIPESSSHQISKAIWNPEARVDADPGGESKDDSETNLDPRARLARISKDLNQPSVGNSAAAARGEGSGKLTAENLDRLDSNDSTYSRQHSMGGGGGGGGVGGSADFAKSLATKETNSKMGDLSWYYSEANVCERCYHVYRDIERKRKLGVREKAVKSYVNPYETMYSSLPSQAKDALKGVPLPERDRYLDARQANFIRRQRSSADRLAQAKGDSVGQGNGDEDESIFGSSMSSIGCDNSDFHRKKYTSPAGAPKGVIPPSPWNLNDESMRSEYAEMGSAFIKNIRRKAKTSSMQVREEENLRELERQMGIDSSTDLDDNFKWKAMTGQGNGGGGQRKSRYSREEDIGPNPMLVKSQSAGDVLRKKRKDRDKQEVKVLSKPFDSSRLMHKWQRDMEAERFSRRQEDVIWKDDVELNNRLQSYQNTGIVQGVVPLKKSKKKTKNSNKSFQAPTVAPNDILNQKALRDPGTSSPMDAIFRSALTLGSGAELGITRKNSLHTIDEADDDEGSLVSPPPKGARASPINNQYASPAKGNYSASSKPPLPSKPVAFSKQSTAPPVQYDDDGDDDEDDDDEGIGWSPFVVPGL
jgi:hypothetical protein